MSDPLAIDVTAAVVGNTGSPAMRPPLPDALEVLGVDLIRFAVGRGSSPDPRIEHLRIPYRIMDKVWRTGHPRAEKLLRRSISLMHSLDLVPPPTRAPRLVTVHDLGGLERPDLHSDLTLAAAERQLAVARGVDLVCAVSEATKAALVGRGIPVDRIHVTPNGMTALCPRRRPPRHEPGYLLTVGTITPRKGFDVLVRALEELPGMRLLMVGPDAFRAEETTAVIEASPARDRIERLGFVDDAALSVLIRDAGAQVVPSRVEGFGIPLLEAMAQRVPLVCSDLPALREVGGEVPWFAGVDDVPGTAEAVRAALAEPRDSPRLQEGAALAATFTWERSRGRRRRPTSRCSAARSSRARPLT